MNFRDGMFCVRSFERSHISATFQCPVLIRKRGPKDFIDVNRLADGWPRASACMPRLGDFRHRAHQRVYYRVIQSAIFSTTSRSMPLKPW